MDDDTLEPGEPSAYVNRDVFQEQGPSADDLCEIVGMIEHYGMIDGAHHKQWLIDQVLRRLMPGYYSHWREAYDEDSRETGYSEWDEGIVP